MPGGFDRNQVVGTVSMLVLGAGFVAMALGVPNFWVVWVLGFAVLVPLLSMFLGDEEDVSTVEYGHDHHRDEDHTADDGAASNEALETLRERYARGELSDEQFERKLERLLETETIEDVEERAADRHRDVERE